MMTCGGGPGDGERLRQGGLDAVGRLGLEPRGAGGGGQVFRRAWRWASRTRW